MINRLRRKADGLESATGPRGRSLHVHMPRGMLAHSIVFMVLVLATFSARRIMSPVPVSPSRCASWGPASGSYHVQLCFSAPASGSSLAGNASVAVSVNQQGSSPGVRRLVFLLDGAYLLTDYEAPYTFTLPTESWANGSHRLSVEASMNDGFTSRVASLPVSFNNGPSPLQAPPIGFQPATGRPANGLPFVVAAAGDGGSGESRAGGVSSRILALHPNLFLYLGDVYERGSTAEFYNWYGSGSNFFSALRSITDPTPGNHEYLTPGASGYFTYWDGIPPYYSFDTNGWHFISLNSSDGDVPAGPGSAQYRWLERDLTARAPNTCTIAYWHRPLYNIGPEGSATWMSAIWSLLAQHGVEIVLNGHDHDYQRWLPLDGSGRPSPGGMTEFVVGSAGHGIEHFVKTDGRVAYSNDRNPAGFGVLLLQLEPAAAGFQFVDSAGAVLDAGSVPCSP